MQGVNMKVTVSKSLDLATYSIRMFGKFPDNVVLAAMAKDLKEVADELRAAQATYEAAVREIISARVDVKYENIVSDRRIRLTQQRAEIADGKKDGKIARALFPEGSQRITRLQGDSQVAAMEDLDGRLEATKLLWADAVAEMADIKNYRENYDIALKGRRAAGQTVQNLRALRDAAKDRFVTKYTQIQARVEAEYPRDKVMQDLFFDEVRTKSALEEADEEDGAEAPSNGEETAKK